MLSVVESAQSDALHYGRIVRNVRSGYTWLTTMMLSGRNASALATSSHFSSPSAQPGRGSRVLAVPTSSHSSCTLRSMI